MVVRRFDLGHRILRDYAAIVFHFDFQLIVRQHAHAKLKDPAEAVRSQTVVAILAHMSLEQNGFVLSHNAAAIDEILRDMANFRDVGVRRDEIAAGQNKTRERVGMLAENGGKIGKFHSRSIFPVRYIVKPLPTPCRDGRPIAIP